MTDATMQAWAVDHPGPIGSKPLIRVERPVPHPGSGQVRVRNRVCGVCRTDLHLAKGDLEPKHHLVIPGHVVGELGERCRRFGVGDRVGVPWLARTCGRCRFCIAGKENLCLFPRFRGWDLDGGPGEARSAVTNASKRLRSSGSVPTPDEIAADAEWNRLRAACPSIPSTSAPSMLGHTRRDPSHHHRRGCRNRRADH